VARKKNKQCYLCGEWGADSRDHIPPKGIFRKNPEGQLITVPAHKKCNSKFEKDDEYFRNYVIMGGGGTAKGKESWQNIVLDSFKKNRGARLELIRDLEKVWVKPPYRNAYERKDAIIPDVKIINREIVRITRGLYFHKYKMYLEQDINIECIKRGIVLDAQTGVNFWNRNFGKDGLALEWTIIEKGVFAYTMGIAKDNPKYGFVFLVFYDSIMFEAFFGA